MKRITVKINNNSNSLSNKIVEEIINKLEILI